MIIFNSLMMVDNKKQHKKKKRKGKTVTMVTRRIEKYLTTQFPTQATNINYKDLQNVLYLIEKNVRCDRLG